MLAEGSSPCLASYSPETLAEFAINFPEFNTRANPGSKMIWRILQCQEWGTGSRLGGPSRHLRHVQGPNRIVCGVPPTRGYNKPLFRPRLLPVPRLLILNKPYGYLSQFTPEGRWQGLAELVSVKDVYVAGRLDADSEGLLLLTDDGRLQSRIAEPRHKLEKTYWAQLEGCPDEPALQTLRSGVRYGDVQTLPAKAALIDSPPGLWERQPPIRYRAAIPTSWLELKIREGKNRQVRRMSAAVGYPTLRLIRAAIGQITLDGLAPGEWRLIQGDHATLSKTLGFV